MGVGGFESEFDTDPANSVGETLGAGGREDEVESAKPVGPTSLGHLFGPLLICGCGTSWEVHQTNPQKCRPERINTRLLARQKTPLNQMRVALGFSYEKVGLSCGIGLAQAQRACNEQVGGRGSVSQSTFDDVESFLKGQVEG